mgnify:CR=1 FL=1
MEIFLISLLKEGYYKRFRKEVLLISYFNNFDNILFIFDKDACQK